MGHRCAIRSGVSFFVGLPLALALLLAGPFFLGAPPTLAQTTGVTYPSCQVGLDLSPCASAPVTTVVGGVGVTESTVGTSACPGGVSVVVPNLPCPTSASQTCADGSVLPATQSCPIPFSTCPDGSQATADSPCPGVPPDSCPHGGFGPMPRDCTGIGGG